MDENEVRHRAIVRLSYKVLREILFPKDTKIVCMLIDTQDIFGKEDFVCVVEHPDLPASRPGEYLVTFAPSYMKHYSGVEGEIPVVTFNGWN